MLNIAPWITITQVSSLHACVDDFHPPGAWDATLDEQKMQLFGDYFASTAGFQGHERLGVHPCLWISYCNKIFTKMTKSTIAFNQFISYFAL